MKTIREYKRMYIGTHNGEKEYLDPPSWDYGLVLGVWVYR